MQPSMEELLRVYGLGQPRELVGALNRPQTPQLQLPGQVRPQSPPQRAQAMPQQLQATEPTGTLQQAAARIQGQQTMPQQSQLTPGMPQGQDLARMLGVASSSLANLGPGATVGQALAALGGGMTAGRMSIEDAQRQSRFDEAQFGQLEARQQQAQTEAQAQAAQAAQMEEYIKTLPSEQQQLLRAFGPSAGVLDRIAPKAENARAQIFGSAETGYYKMGADGQPEQLIGASPRGPLAVTNVAAPQPGETEYDKTRGKDFATRAAEIDAAGRFAEEQIASIGPLMASLANPDVYQGTGGNAITSLKRFGKTMMGLDFEGVGDAEVVATIGNQMALQLRSMMPGPMSDGDRRFLQSLPPNLGNSREGNLLIGEFFRRSAERNVERAEAARKYEAENGRLNAGFDRKWAEYMRANPVFDEADYAATQSLAAAAPQPTPLAGVPDDIADLLGRYGGN